VGLVYHVTNTAYQKQKDGCMDLVQSKGKICIITSVLVFSSLAYGQTPAITPGPDAQFDVASIKADDPKSPRSATNLDLDASDYFRYQGGPVIADNWLVNYIIFAYKLEDSGEYKSLNAQLPKWAQYQNSPGFRLEARAGDHPTKDDLRGMMRSLLAERFGLKVHTETQQQVAWVLVKTSSRRNSASQLQPHTGEPVCGPVHSDAQPAKPKPGEIPPYCGPLILRDAEGNHLRIMDYTMPQIAGVLGMLAVNHEGMNDLPQVDGTQMTGKFDLDLHYADSKAPSVPDGRTADAEQAADAQPDLLQALNMQAGLEFKKKTVPVEVLVVDHVNEPTPD
jgi:uncharacterized protein (TIGR03435 family)